MSQCQQAQLLLDQFRTLHGGLIISQQKLIASSIKHQGSREQLYNQIRNTNTEMRNTIEQLEKLTTLEIERLLNLEEQYHRRVTTLLKLGLVQELRIANRELRIGITGVDDQTYYLPTYQQLKKELLNNKEQRQILTTKYYQGFTKLSIVPFALPLSEFFKIARANLIRLKAAGKLRDTDDKELDLNEDDPFYTWEKYLNADTKEDPGEASMLYYPDQYDQDNHGGKTKLQLLQSTGDRGQVTDTIKNFTAFHFLLLEDKPNLPEAGQVQTLPGNETIKSNETMKDIQKRTQLPPGLSAIAYLKKLQSDPQYVHEQGLTAEDWLTLFLTYLEEENITIDDWDKGRDGKGKISWLLGTYFPSFGDVGIAYWSRDDRQARLGRGYAGGDWGHRLVRSVVPLRLA